MKNQKLICIGGPTCVGKTALGIEIAKKFGGEIVSCDSIAIYRDIDIGSAKPTKQEQSQAKHHMIDVVLPNSEYSVAEYCKDANAKIEEIYSRKKIPIVVGGTGLYMKSLLFDMDFGKSEKSDEIRKKYKKIAEEKGNEYLLDYLKTIDEKSAEKLHPKDQRRIIRAIEIFELTNKKKSDYVNDQKSKYDYLLIFLNDSRKDLYARIDDRVDKMFDLGLEDEVKNLVKKYNLTRESQSMEAIGYREFFDYFEGKIDHKQLVEKIKLDSHHYAKRQLTWFKKMPLVQEFDCHNKTAIMQKVEDFFKK